MRLVQVLHGSVRCLEALLVAAGRAPGAGGLRDEANAPLLAFLTALFLKVRALTPFWTSACGWPSTYQIGGLHCVLPGSDMCACTLLMAARTLMCTREVLPR